MVHLYHACVSSWLILKHVILSGSFNRTIFRRVYMTQFCKCKYLLTCITCWSLMSSCVSALISLHYLSNNIFLLFEVLVDILVSHFIFTFRGRLAVLEWFLPWVSRGTHCFRSSSSRVFQRVTWWRWCCTWPPQVIRLICMQTFSVSCISHRIRRRIKWSRRDTDSHVASSLCWCFRIVTGTLHRCFILPLIM